jgi:nucleotide-binding universal stress UspA family protein/predicted transcriptional regulator
MTKTIVVAVMPPALDPHGVAEAALPYARILAERNSARVVLVSAVDLLPTFNPLTRTLVRPSIEAIERVVTDTRDYLARLAAQLPADRVETVVRTGATVRQLLAELSERPEPLLVVTSHARKGLDRLLVGSVAFQLVREVTCPVLVVRGLTVEAAQQPRLANVLVPLDLSPLSDQAIALVLSTLPPDDLQVHLLHVVEPVAHRNIAPHEILSVMEPRAQRHLREAAQPLIQRGYRVTTEVRPGKAVEVIAEVAKEVGADLIAMTTHGRSGWHRVLLGSVAEHLVRLAPDPLLLIRPVAPHGDQQAAEEAYEEAGAAEARAWRAMVETAPALWERRAREIMVQPVVVAQEDTPLADVVEVMLEQRIGSVPVVDQQGKLTGIITKSDFVGDGRCIPLAAYQVPQLFREQLSEEAVQRIYQTGREMTAKEIMTHPVIAVAEDDPVGKVVQILLRHGIGQVPVVRDGVPVGIIARRDLLKLLLPPEEIPVEESSAQGGNRSKEPSSRETA